MRRQASGARLAPDRWFPQHESRHVRGWSRVRVGSNAIHSDVGHRTGSMIARRLAMTRWSNVVLRHKALTVLLWLLFLIPAGLATEHIGDRLSAQTALPGQPAYEAN